MELDFVKIGERFFNLHAILWAEMSGSIHDRRLTLIYGTSKDNNHERFVLINEEADTMIKIIQNNRKN